MCVSEMVVWQGTSSHSCSAGIEREEVKVQRQIKDSAKKVRWCHTAAQHAVDTDLVIMMFRVT